MAVLWRWTLIGIYRNPLVGGIWLAVGLCMPLVAALRPFPVPGSSIEVGLALAMPVGLFASALGMVHLSRNADFLARFAPPARWGAELGGIVFATLSLQLPIALGAALVPATALDLGRALPDILTADLHLAALALLFLALPLTTRARLAMFVGMAWVIPALCTRSAIARVASAPFDAGRLLREPASAARFSALAAGLALALSAYLLRCARTRSSR